MSLIYADRVQETTATTGTAVYALGGAVLGCQTFSSALTNGQQCGYAVTDGMNWEAGIGAYDSVANTLARTIITASSNGGAVVSWSAGTKLIWLDQPAAQIFPMADMIGLAAAYG